MIRGVLWYVFVGSRGGMTRLRIVQSLDRHPKNANELTRELLLDYSTIRHSLRVLEKNRLVFGADGYGGKYQLSPEFSAMRREFDELVKKMGAK